MTSKNIERRPKRVKNELNFRTLVVKNKQKIAGCFYRITFGSDQLTGFSSLGFDDHIKMFFPVGDTPCVLPTMTPEGIVWPDGQRPVTRDYTPLAFNPERNELVVDFFIHDGGIASQWAVSAKAGDTLTIGGPRGSLVIPTDYSWQLYICDESGLPAVQRRLLSLPENIVPQVLVKCSQPQTQAYLSEFSRANIEWLDIESIASKLKSLTIPTEDYFIWITGEGDEVKNLSDDLLASHKLDTNFVRTVAYWHKK